MKIKFTQHATERMRRRRISKGDVKEAIVNGQHRQWQIHDGTIKCTLTKNNRKLIVIYKQVKDKYIIITAYFI